MVRLRFPLLEDGNVGEDEDVVGDDEGEDRDPAGTGLSAPAAPRCAEGAERLPP